MATKAVPTAVSETDGLVLDQLALTPAQRLEVLCGWWWPEHVEAVDLAAKLYEVAAVGGSLAAALHGAANRPSKRLDLLYPDGGLSRLSERLLDVGASPNGIEQLPSGQGRRSHWRWHTVNATTSVLLHGVDFDDDTELLSVGDLVVRVLSPAMTLELSRNDVWDEDRVYAHSLEAAVRLGAASR